LTSFTDQLLFLLLLLLLSPFSYHYYYHYYYDYDYYYYYHCHCCCYCCYYYYYYYYYYYFFFFFIFFFFLVETIGEFNRAHDGKDIAGSLAAIKKFRLESDPERYRVYEALFPSIEADIEHLFPSELELITAYLNLVAELLKTRKTGFNPKTIERGIASCPIENSLLL